MECFIEVDLKGAEWVVVAYYSEDGRMLEIIENNLNPHVITGQLISGASEEFILKEAALIGHTTDPEEIEEKRKELEIPPGVFLPRVMTIYQAGKKSNHGLNYDMRYVTFSLVNEMPESDGKRCCDKYHEGYPGIRNGFHKRVRQLLITEGRLTNCFGEVYPVYEDLNNKILDAAYSAIPQSTVSYITTQGIDRTYRAYEPELRKVEPLANVHDSMLTQAAPRDPSEALAIMEALDRAMTQECEYHGRKFTIPREFKIGLNWGEAAMKEVKGLNLQAVTEAWDAAKSAA